MMLWVPLSVNYDKNKNDSNNNITLSSSSYFVHVWLHVFGLYNCLKWDKTKKFCQFNSYGNYLVLFTVKKSFSFAQNVFHY